MKLILNCDCRNFRLEILELTNSGISVVTYAYGDRVLPNTLMDSMRRWSPDARTRFSTSRARSLAPDQRSLHEDTADKVTFMQTLCQEIPSKYQMLITLLLWVNLTPIIHSLFFFLSFISMCWCS